MTPDPRPQTSPEALKTYWEERSRGSFTYRGESFYTVTPVPLYYQRRARLLKALQNFLSSQTSKTHSSRLLDFGCGDGFYSIWIKQNFPQFDVTGRDLSIGMIESAKHRSSELGLSIEFSATMEIAPKSYSTCVIIAVLAHILDRHTLLQCLRQIYEGLEAGGRVFAFEATTKKQARSGLTWQRRSIAEYEALFESTGFKVERIDSISFPLFNLLESPLRLCFLLFLKLFKPRQAFNLNHLPSFVRCNEWILALGRWIDPFLTSHKGNTIFILRKP